MRLSRCTRLVATLALVAAPGAAQAQGYGLNEIGSCAIARGFANTSAPCKDASSIFWNPAAITTLSGNSGLVGAAMIAVKGDFTQDTTGRLFQSDITPEFPPHLFWANHSEKSQWAYGVGVYVPYGLTSEWSPDFPGRFSAQHASVKTIYVQPNLAYKINDKWSIGIGPIVGRSSLALDQSIDLAEQVVVPATSTTPAITFANFGIARGTEFATVHATGSDWGFGFNVGIHANLNENWEFGARYLSKVKFDYDGDAEFTQVNTGLIIGGTVPGAFPAGTQIDTLVRKNFESGGKLAPQSVSTSLTHPSQVQFGFTYKGIEATSLSFEYTWLGWKAFKELPVNFGGGAGTRSLIEDYNNSSVFRFGAERMLTSGAALRAGATAATSAAPAETVTPLLPEQDRYTLNLGGGWPLGKRWTVDGAYAYVGTWGSRGRIVERTNRQQTAAQLNTGFYRLHANILSVSLKATY